MGGCGLSVTPFLTPLPSRSSCRLVAVAEGVVVDLVRAELLELSELIAEAAARLLVIANGGGEDE